MDILKEIGIDPEKEDKGDWEKFFGKFEFCVAAWENDAMLKAMSEMDQDLSEAEDIDQSDAIIARHVIKDWKPFTYDGQDGFAYSPENAVKILQDKRLRPLRKRIIRFARREENYRSKQDQKAAKNS